MAMVSGNVNTRKSNRSVANNSNRSNFRSTNGQRLDPLPPRGNRGGAGSVSGRKSVHKRQNNQPVDVVFFPTADNKMDKQGSTNMTSIGNQSSKSAF